MSIVMHLKVVTLSFFIRILLLYLVSYFQFKKPRFPDELEAGLLYAEHMIEVGQQSPRPRFLSISITLLDYIGKTKVGQYLMRKAREKAGRNGKVMR